MLTVVAVPEHPLLPHLLRGYEKWEAEDFPAPSMRSGLSCSIMQNTLCFGMGSSVLQTVRDCAACVFAYFCNECRVSLQCNFNAHSLRIGSHTEQVLL